VAAITAGDGAGMAAVFDRHAEGLYTYCRSQLAAPADVADAVLATFVVTSAEIPRLSQPDRLRAWLFAVARNECHTRLRAAGPSARLYEAASAMDDTGAFAVCTQHAETRATVRAALAGMDPVDREVSELNLRHGFYGADLADLLGAPRNKAHALAARARSQFERSLGVLLMAKSEREHCPGLGAILDGAAGQSTMPLRWRVRRHVGSCDVCGERKRSGLNPAILLNLLPAIGLPSDLRQQTLDLVVNRSPVARAYRARVLDRAAPLDADGFPVQLATPSAPGWRVSSASAVAAAAAAVALLGGAMYYAHHLPGQTAPVPPVIRRPPLPGPAKFSGTKRTPPGSPATPMTRTAPPRSPSPSHSSSRSGLQMGVP
jgi:RNA polymerase sigma factor (sigma-70 family)